MILTFKSMFLDTTSGESEGGWEKAGFKSAVRWQAPGRMSVAVFLTAFFKCSSASEPPQFYAVEPVPAFEDEFGPSVLFSVSPDLSCPSVWILGLAVVV